MVNLAEEPRVNTTVSFLGRRRRGAGAGITGITLQFLKVCTRIIEKKLKFVSLHMFL